MKHTTEFKYILLVTIFLIISNLLFKNVMAAEEGTTNRFTTIIGWIKNIIPNRPIVNPDDVLLNLPRRETIQERLKQITMPFKDQEDTDKFIELMCLEEGVPKCGPGIVTYIHLRCADFFKKLDDAPSVFFENCIIPIIRSLTEDDQVVQESALRFYRKAEGL